MPFRRTHRRRRRRRRKGRGRGMSTRAAAFKALAHVDLELKVLNRIDNFTVDVENAAIIPLSEIADGPALTERIGNQLKMKSFLLRFSVFTATAPTLENTVRIMLVLDKQPSGAIFTDADLLENAANPIESPLNLAGSRRFKVMWSKTIIVTSTLRPRVYTKVFKRLSFTTRYSGAGATTNALQSNGLYICYFSDSLGTVGVQPTISSITRVRWVG